MTPLHKTAQEAIEMIATEDLSKWASRHDKVVTGALKSAIHAEQAQAVEPKCVARIEVFGKDWKLDYLSLPVGVHELYAQTYTYTHPTPPPAGEHAHVPETDFGNISGARAALIAKLRDRTVLPRIPDREAMADMLEADGALADDLTIAYMAGVEAGQKQAQQVAVPESMVVSTAPSYEFANGWNAYRSAMLTAQGAKLVTKKDHKPDWSAA